MSYVAIQALFESRLFEMRDQRSITAQEEKNKACVVTHSIQHLLALRAAVIIVLIPHGTL